MLLQNAILGISTSQEEEKSSKFSMGTRVQHGTPEEDRRMHRLKRYEYSNEDEDKNPNILSDKNYRGSFEKLRQINIKVTEYGLRLSGGSTTYVFSGGLARSDYIFLTSRIKLSMEVE